MGNAGRGLTRTGSRNRSWLVAAGCLLVLVILTPGQSAIASADAGERREPAAGKHYDGYVVEETTLRNRYQQDLRVKLAFPAIRGQRALGRFPVILMYTTYCREPDSSFDVPGAPGLLLSGYVIAAVYQPGMCGSEGHTEVYPPAVAKSGYDAVEWLAHRPWATGKVGMIGFSSPASPPGSPPRPVRRTSPPSSPTPRAPTSTRT